MEKIDKQLNNLNTTEMSPRLHSSIMRIVNHKKMQPMFLILFFLLVFNFIIIFWHINTKLVDAEFGVMMNDLFTDFDLSFYFIGTIISSFFEIISPALVLSLFISFFGSIYVYKKNIYLFNFYKI